MANVGVTRKLFIDSRYKVGGTDADFLIELPADVDCTRTSSFFVASCSFANTYQTVTAFNNTFYFVTKIPNTNITTIFSHPVPPGAYAPSEIATVLAGVLNLNATGLQNAALAFNADTGTFTVTYTSFAGIILVIPNYVEIDNYGRDASIIYDSSPWTGWQAGPKFQSINTLLNCPLQYPSFSQTSPFQTGVIDLSPLREVYLHCSIANNRTLHINGARDCIARIPIDVDFGQVVTYRHLGPTDALSCSDVHFRTIRFQLRDWAGNLAPTGSFVVVELCFLDTDPYAM